MHDSLENELVPVKVSYVRAASLALMRAECDQIVADFISAYNNHFQKKKWWHKLLGIENPAVLLTSENTRLIIRSDGLDLEWQMPQEAEKNIEKEHNIICQDVRFKSCHELALKSRSDSSYSLTDYMLVYEQAITLKRRSRVLYEDIYAKNDDSIVELSVEDIEFLAHSEIPTESQL